MPLCAAHASARTSVLEHGLAVVGIIFVLKTHSSFEVTHKISSSFWGMWSAPTSPKHSVWCLPLWTFSNILITTCITLPFFIIAALSFLVGAVPWVGPLLDSSWYPHSLTQDRSHSRNFINVCKLNPLEPHELQVTSRRPRCSWHDFVADAVCFLGLIVGYHVLLWWNSNQTQLMRRKCSILQKDSDYCSWLCTFDTMTWESFSEGWVPQRGDHKLEWLGRKARGALQAVAYEAESATLREQKRFHPISDCLSNGRKGELSLFYVALQDEIPIITESFKVASFGWASSNVGLILRQRK